VAAPAKKKKPSSPKHKCGYARCNFCGFEKEFATHKCYIQPLHEEEGHRKTKLCAADKLGSRKIVGYSTDTDMYLVEEPPPVFVYADYEAISDTEGLQHPILLCCETNENSETEIF